MVSSIAASDCGVKGLASTVVVQYNAAGKVHCLVHCHGFGSRPMFLFTQDATHPSVRHALQVRQSLALGDSTLACRLYISAPNMGRALLDILLPKIRFAALRVFAKAYSPAIPTSFIARHLGFVAVEQISLPQQSAQALYAQAALPGCSRETLSGQFPPQVGCSNPHRYATHAAHQASSHQFMSAAA